MSNYAKLQRYIQSKQSNGMSPLTCNRPKQNSISDDFETPQKEAVLFDNRIIEKREWLTTREAAEYLRISPKALLNKVCNGTISAYKLGRSNRYSTQELRELLLSSKKGDSYVY